MAGTPYALNYVAPQARDAARDTREQLDDYYADTCVVCGHDVLAHGRSGCFDCSCIDEPRGWDPTDD
jgi:hypothetical protein